MGSLYILFSLLLIAPVANAGLFSSDHKLVRDKKCIVKLGGRYNHEVVCAIHQDKKKQNLSFCQGDVVLFDGNKYALRVFTIKGSMAYGKDVKFNKSLKFHTDKAKVVKKKSCDERKAYIEKNAMTVIRAYHNKNYTGR